MLTPFSKLRVFRIRLRYYYWQAIYKYKHIKFISDNSQNFRTLLEEIKTKKYKKAVILGNASNLTYLNPQKYMEYKNNENILTIGLNNSYMLYDTDFVLWGEQFVMKMLLEYKKEIPRTTFIFVSQLLDDRRKGLLFWKQNKTFDNYPLETLFKARTILVSALYLCYVSNITKIELYGVSLDDYSHFYTQGEDSRKTFEFLSEERIKKEYYGYSVHNIVQEVLEFLLSKNFKINYGGESKFLSSINGMNKV